LSIPWRILCLSNDLLADDAFGWAVAEELRQLPAEVVCASEAGFDLLDYILNVSSLAVVDTILTGTADPGTVYVLGDEDLRVTSGSSPHYTGLMEVLQLGERLALPIPEKVVIIAVEAADCLTVGGAMHPAVRDAVPRVVNLIRRLVDGCTPRDLSW